MTEAGKPTEARSGMLQGKYGREIELTDDRGTATTYRIMAELEVRGASYAVLQSEDMRKEGDIEVFRILLEDGEPQLASLDDDDEWEDVAEAYDDLQFGTDERP